MNKKTLSILSILLVASGIFLFSGIDNSVNTDNEFNYCQETELFGLKYESCNDMNCIEFHEDIKQSLKEEYCN